MGRKSSDADKKLKTLALKRLEESGFNGISVRELCKEAEINLGTFHYQFKSKDAFIKEVLQDNYEEFFANFTERIDSDAPPLERLEMIMGGIADFLYRNHLFLASLLKDAMDGNQVVVNFFKANLPRHAGVILATLREGQKDKTIIDLPPIQILGFMMSSIAGPLIFMSQIVQKGKLAPAIKTELKNHFGTRESLDSRILIVLRAISAPTNKKRSLK